jgi:hypothetical protein
VRRYCAQRFIIFAPPRYLNPERQNAMTIKAGSIVSNAAAQEWGVGKVLEVTAAMATIQFSDGKSRKIAASHFTILQPAAAASYTPPPVSAPVVKAVRAHRAAKKK